MVMVMRTGGTVRMRTSNVALVHAVILAVPNGYALLLMRLAQLQQKMVQQTRYVYQCQACELGMA